MFFNVVKRSSLLIKYTSKFIYAQTSKCKLFLNFLQLYGILNVLKLKLFEIQYVWKCIERKNSIITLKTLTLLKQIWKHLR